MADLLKLSEFDVFKNDPAVRKSELLAKVRNTNPKTVAERNEARKIELTKEARS